MAPAWKSDFELTAARAEDLFESGQVMWGLDEEQEIFDAYAIPYQPVTVLIAADRTVVDSWPGLRPAEEIRTAIEDLIALSG